MTFFKRVILIQIIFYYILFNVKFSSGVWSGIESERDRGMQRAWADHPLPPTHLSLAGWPWSAEIPLSQFLSLHNEKKRIYFRAIWKVSGHVLHQLPNPMPAGSKCIINVHSHSPGFSHSLLSTTSRVPAAFFLESTAPSKVPMCFKAPIFWLLYGNSVGAHSCQATLISRLCTQSSFSDTWYKGEEMELLWGGIGGGTGLAHPS